METSIMRATDTVVMYTFVVVYRQRVYQLLKKIIAAERFMATATATAAVLYSARQL